MQSCAACCCWRGQRPPSGASLGRRPTRPPKVGGSRLLQAAPAGAEPGCALHLFLGAHPQPLALRGFQVHRGMTSEGRSLHLARPDPIQLDQHAPRRSWHPAGRRWGKVERARVAAMRAMQLLETHSPASPQLANSARGPPGAKGAGQRCHGAKRALSLKTRQTRQKGLATRLSDQSLKRQPQ